jgi:hypothetical protein
MRLPLLRSGARAPIPVVFAPPIATFRTQGSAAENDVANGLVLTVECDKDAPKAHALLEGLIGTATLVVASGGQWVDPETGEITPKLHLHWRLKEPTRDFADHQKLKQARLLAQRLVGSDASAVPLVHPIRWPGSWHRKAEPRLARIVGGNVNAEIELADAYEHLCEAAAAAGREQPAEQPRASSEPQADEFDVIAALHAIPNNDVPWDEWNRIGLAAWRATGGSEAGFAAFAAWSAKSDKNDRSVTRGRWDHFATSPPSEIGAGTLFFLANQARSRLAKAVIFRAKFVRARSMAGARPGSATALPPRAARIAARCVWRLGSPYRSGGGSRIMSRGLCCGAAARRRFGVDRKCTMGAGGARVGGAAAFVVRQCRGQRRWQEPRQRQPDARCAAHSRTENGR